MPTTTNYGWTTPADTDLVKDGASAIRTLGTAIDTTVFNNASAGIAKTIVDAKGDIIAATAADTVARLAVGANDTILTADSSTATGLKWAAAGGAGANWSLLNAGGTALSGSSTVTVSGISSKDKIMVFLTGVSSASGSSQIQMRFNADSNSNYNMYGLSYTWAASYDSSNYGTSNFQSTEIYLGNLGTSAGDAFGGFLLMSGCNAAGVKIWNAANGSNGNSVSGGHRITGGWYNSSSTISSVSLISNSGNFDAGTIFVYTSA